MEKFEGNCSRVLFVEDSVDEEGEVCFELSDMESMYIYLSVDKVKALIKHLEGVVSAQEGI